MFGRVFCNLKVFSPYVNKQKQLANVHHQCTRLLSRSVALSIAKQEKDDAELMFDLGGTTESSISKSRNITKARTTTTPTPIPTPTKSKTSSKSSSEPNIPKNKKARTFEQLLHNDPTLNLTYVKLPFDHPEFPKLMLMLKSRKYRQKKNLLLIEGRRLALEAIEAGLKMRYLMFSNSQQIEAIRKDIQTSLTKKTEIIRVPHNDLTSWSTLTTCPGLIAVFEKPNDMNTVWENVKISKPSDYLKWKKNADLHTNDETTLGSMPITVICDQVREPNNLGSIIRTCASVPCSRIILLKGCVDPWDIKSLRGGCGAQFRIPIIESIEWENLTEHIPDTDSLSVFIADNKVPNDVQIPRDEYEEKRKQNNAHFFQPKLYSDISFSNCKHILLIIGGETEGVSSHALDFMQFISNQTKKPNDNEIVRPENAIVQIPLGNGVESLNASVATAVLLFEMRKQLLQ